ncbi:MAG: hypothetical protein QXX34_06215 [Candidatus Bathyarchaeia archaeon]
MTADSDEEKTLITPGLATQTEIFEQVEGGHFLVWDRIEQKFIINANDVWRSYRLNGVCYVPLKPLPWPSATTAEFYESEERLFNEIRQFFIEHLDVQNELLYDVYAAFVLASWRVEDFKVVPYLFFLGPMASGKTRALECLQQLCFRSIIAATVSSSSVFRAIEAWHPTFLLDESEIYNREEKKEVLALLNSGYRRGQYAIRVEKIEEGNPVLSLFNTFGFKGIAGTEELAATLQSRCIITHMSRAVREVRLFIDEEKAQALRNQLLFYRFKNLGKNIDYSASDFIKENGYFRNARVIELFISLIQVAPSVEVKQRLLKCMRQIAQSRLEEEQASVEAKVFEAILKCEDKVENGKLSTQAVTEAFNEGLPEKEHVSSRFIGRKVAALGFEKCRVGERGQAGFYWDEKLVERLKMRYSLKLTSETSETSETSVGMDKTAALATFSTEVSEENSSANPRLETAKSPLNTEVSEETEVTEVKSGVGIKNQLLVGRTKNAEKCYYCELVASEYELDDSGNKYYVCSGCLKEVIIPAYKRQNYEITFVSEVS